MTSPHNIVQQAQALAAAGKAPQAAAMLARALARAPRDSALLSAMAHVLTSQGDLTRARYHARLAVETAGSDAPAALAAVLALLRCEDLHQAARVLEGAPALPPAASERFMTAALSAGAPSLAERVGAAAMSKPAADHRPSAGLSLAYASALLALGRPEDAYACAVRAAESTGHAALLQHAAVLSNYCEEDPVRVREVHGAFARSVEQAVARDRRPVPVHDPRPDRPLRLGLLSGDFREHSVMWFLRAFLECRDRAASSLVCFSTQHAPDAATDFVRARCDAMHNITGQHPAAARDLIVRERVDVLVDLSGHSSGSSPHLLALRAAPVQATMIGYPATTGLSTVDVRVVDTHTDPVGAERFASERLTRLDPCFLCYTPREHVPDPVPRPADAPVVFASFNALMKHTLRTLAMWGRVLNSVPAARLVMKNKSLGDAGARETCVARLRAAGIDPERVDLLPWAQNPADHMLAYQAVDIALDTFPYQGTTTTCEALFMGVPVVSRVGRTHASRVGLSLLGQVGLADLACDSDDAFVHAATTLALDAPRRAGLRSTLRARLLGSPLGDGPGHTRRVEEAFRQEWSRACVGGRPL